MELKAQYGFNDLIELVKKDLAVKGFSLVGELESIGQRDFALIATVEQSKAQPTPAPAAPAQVQASEKPKPKPTAQVNEKRQATLAKAREKYAEKKKAEKLAAKQVTQKIVLPEVVAPSTVPFQYQQPALNGNGHHGS
jgi:hypothetical protein